LSASPKTPLTYSAPPDLLVGLRRPTCKGRGGKERGGEGEREGGKGMGSECCTFVSLSP